MERTHTDVKKRRKEISKGNVEPPNIYMGGQSRASAVLGLAWFGSVLKPHSHTLFDATKFMRIR